MGKPSLIERMPTKDPGEIWTAWDGKDYTIHADGTTLIDEGGNYLSPFDLQPLPKDTVDFVAPLACATPEDVERAIAMS